MFTINKMSRQSRATIIARKRSSVELGVERGDRRSKVSQSLSTLGIGRNVADKTVGALSAAWQAVAGDRAYALQLSRNAQLVIVAGDELSQLRGWKDYKDDVRDRNIGGLLTKLVTKDTISRSATKSVLDVLVEDPEEMFSIDSDGHLVATLIDLADSHPLSREIAAVRNVLGLDEALPGQCDSKIQLVFGAAAEENSLNEVNRVSVKRLGALMPAAVSFMPIGSIAPI